MQLVYAYVHVTHRMALSCAQPGQLISPGCVVLHLKSAWPWSPWPPVWPDDSPGLPSTFNMRRSTGKYKRNFPGWRTHRQTYVVAYSFLQQASPSKEWFIFSRKDADQRNLALFENPAWQCNGARQLSPEHIVTDAYADCS